MKRTNYILAFITGTVILFSFLFYTSSCKKNHNCKVTITVIDASTGGPVPAATVSVSPTQTAPQGNLTIQSQAGITDGSGSISFTFTLPAILQAAVVPPSPPYTGGTKTALIQLQEGGTVTKTIQVN